jgi:phosphoglycolate phosphatase
VPWRNEPITLFLDYDGTLHESLYVYAPAFRLAYADLVRQGLAPEQQIDDAQIGHWLGYTAQEMWTTFLPHLAEAQWKAASQMVGAEMLRLTQTGKAQLYDHALDTLTQLKAQGYQLVFLSNCSHPYMEAHRQAFQLDRFFSAFYCIADYPVMTKAALYQLVAPAHPGKHIIIGDRFHDLAVAKQFQLPSIGCRYGYSTDGELNDATCIIDAITELPNAVEQIIEKYR